MHRRISETLTVPGSGNPGAGTERICLPQNRSLRHSPRIPGAGSPVRKNRNEEVLSARRTPGAMMRHRPLCPAAKRRIYCGFTQV